MKIINRHTIVIPTKVGTLRSGFTLIELMIVMIIMGVLAAIGVSAFVSSQVKGRDSTRKGNLRAIANALELYYSDKGQYPTDDNNGNGGGLKGCWTTGGAAPATCVASQLWQDTVASTIYMAQFPKDPVSTQRYFYKATPLSGLYTQYQIYTHLENTQDTQIDPAIVAKGYNCASSGTATCNYGISSANLTP